MAFENMDEAAQALAAAVSGSDTPEQTANLQAAGSGAPAPYPNQPAEPPTPTTTGDEGDQGASEPVAPAVEEFTPSKDIDLSGLDDEQREYLQAREREMQSAFTRRTQELAQQRQEAEQALQFLNELNTNPNFALQVVNELSTQLQEAGYTPAEAQAQAQQAVAQQQQGQPTVDDLGFEDDGFDDDPYLSEIEKLRQGQQRLQQTLDQRDQQAAIAQRESQLNNMAAYVQSQNPDFGDSDMAKIVNMAYAYNGDIIRAAQEYKTIREDAIRSWMERKDSVTAPATLTSGGSAQPAPEKFTGLDDPRLEAAAIRRLNEALGG